MYSIRYSYIHVCIKLGIYQVYKWAQGYEVEGWAGRIGRGEALKVDRERVGDTGGERSG